MGEYARLPWSERAGARIGHHASAMLVGSIAAAVFVGLYPLPGLLAYTVPMTLFAFVLLSWLLMRAHDRRLCEQCVMAMPLNPAEKATKLTRRFWMAHTGSEPRSPHPLPRRARQLELRDVDHRPDRLGIDPVDDGVPDPVPVDPPQLAAVVPMVQRRRRRRRSRRDRPSSRTTTASVSEQVPRLSTAGLEFVTERHLATLTTLRADGSPHVTPVGFTWDETAGCAYVICSGTSRKAAT